MNPHDLNKSDHQILFSRITCVVSNSYESIVYACLSPSGMIANKHVVNVLIVETIEKRARGNNGPSSTNGGGYSSGALNLNLINRENVTSKCAMSA